MSGIVREERIGNARLLLGDCVEILPSLDSIDHIISDPPYEDEVHNAMGRIKRNDGRIMLANSGLGFDGKNAIRNEVAGQCVVASSGWLILFTLAEGVRAWREEIQAHGGKWDTTLAWIKPDASPRFNGQGAARGFECAVTAWCGKGHRSWNGSGKRGVFTHCVNSNRQGEHPTEKPVALMAELIGLYTQPRQTVCDPFLGSGTTGIAAIQAGRRFVGIEKDQKWFDLACRRIEAAHRQADLFIPREDYAEIAKPVQGDMVEWMERRA